MAHSSEISLIAEAWNASEIPQEQRGLAVIWESLRLVKLSTQNCNDLPDVVHKITIKASESGKFQRFCRREHFRPVSLLAWICVNQQWPTAPWSEVSALIIPELDRIERLPALFHGDFTKLSETRHQTKIQRSFDQLSILVIYPTRFGKTQNSVENQLPFELNLLGRFNALQGHHFIINWQQFTKKEIIAKFGEWLNAN